MVSGSISPPYSGYFSPFPHGTCSLSVSQEYLALPDGAGNFRRSFTGSALLRIPASNQTLRVRDCHPVSYIFPDSFHFSLIKLCRSYYPEAALTASVWAPSRSLATTWEITVVFSSYGYLDVSVPRVRLLTLGQHDWPSTSRVAPFGHLRINSYLPIPAAYRSLSRPSSPLRAKASPIHPYSFSSTRILLTYSFIFFTTSYTSCQRTFLTPTVLFGLLISVDKASRYFPAFVKRG